MSHLCQTNYLCLCRVMMKKKTRSMMSSEMRQEYDRAYRVSEHFVSKSTLSIRRCALQRIRSHSQI
jgi:hypothetical protein